MNNSVYYNNILGLLYVYPADEVYCNGDWWLKFHYIGHTRFTSRLSKIYIIFLAKGVVGTL